MRIPFVDQYKETALEEVIYLPVDEVDSAPPVVITNDKKLTKFIKTIERMVRSSYEYREYISYLVNVRMMNFCSVFQNVSRNTAKNIRIEIHHEPFTLYDIVYIVYMRFLNEGREIDPFMISDEVLELHFRGNVGLIPLSKTVHELVHVGRVFIPINFIDQGFFRFYQEYKAEIDETPLKDLLEKKIELSKTFNFKSNNVLHKKYLYIDHEDYKSVPEEIPDSNNDNVA